MNKAEGRCLGEGPKADRRSFPGLAEGHCNGGFTEKHRDVMQKDSEADVDLWKRADKGREVDPTTP